MGVSYGDVLALDFSGTSPASATTTVGTANATADLSGYNKAIVYGIIQGATGGTLDVYLQTSYDSGTTWVDLLHFTQKSAAAAAVGYVMPITRGIGGATTAVTVNTVSTTPVLANSAVVPGGLGNRLRRVDVAGASTSAGAAQTIQVLLSTV